MRPDDEDQILDAALFGQLFGGELAPVDDLFGGQELVPPDQAETDERARHLHQPRPGGGARADAPPVDGCEAAMGSALTNSFVPGELAHEGLRITSIVHPGSRAVTQVLSCMRTQTAAIIDPRPENQAEAARACRGLKLRLQLHTNAIREQRSRLDALRTGIGLSARTDASQPPEARCLQVAPVDAVVDGRWGLSINGQVIRIGLGRTGIPYTIRGEISAPELKVDQVRLAFGAWHIEVFPLVWDDGLTLAYSAGGRVWFGGLLRSPARPEGAQADRVLPIGDVPWGDDILLYPSWARDGICVGNMRQEKLIVGVAEGARLSGTYRDQDLQGLDDLAGVDGLLTPEPEDVFERVARPPRRISNSVPPAV